MERQQHINEFGQVIGELVNAWKAKKFPDPKALKGVYCDIAPLDPKKHAKDLYEVLKTDDESWTYLAYGPFANYENFLNWLMTETTKKDPQFYLVIGKENNRVIGMLSYLRIHPEHATIEIGHIHFSPLLKKTRIGTEALFLLIQRIFEELEYRRCEWKCDSLNVASRRSAERLGFVFEGIFRKNFIYKNRSRDAAWYAITEDEWPSLKNRLKAWLSIDNFDEQGKQKCRLSDIEKPVK